MLGRDLAGGVCVEPRALLPMVEDIASIRIPVLEQVLVYLGRGDPLERGVGTHHSFTRKLQRNRPRPEVYCCHYVSASCGSDYSEIMFSGNDTQLRQKPK
jgi:hypothetical protein